jgi:hypothetical protein
MKFWFENPSNLYKELNLIPSDESSIEKKINYATSAIIIISVIAAILSKNMNILFLALIFMLFTVIIFRNKVIEKFTLNEKKDECVEPNLENPFMNTLIGEKRSDKVACKYDNEIKGKIDKNFNTNLYLDANDVFGKRNSQRQFYTTANTSVPNKREDLGNWLYGQPNKIFKDEYIENNIYQK